MNAIRIKIDYCWPILDQRALVYLCSPVALIEEFLNIHICFYFFHLHLEFSFFGANSLRLRKLSREK